MSSHSHVDQSSPKYVYNLRDCTNDFKEGEYNSCDCNTYVQYTLSCSKCKESLVYQEKGQATMDKVFHERFARHKVLLKGEILSIREVAN